LRSGTSRYQGSGLAAAFAIFLAVYVGFAFCFYWLMQPTVVGNGGLAAYHPPPNTVVRYADSPWVPPADSEPFTSFALAEPARASEATSAEAPKTETKTRETRTAPRRQHAVRTRPSYGRSFASPFGFRPWF
jgi:hypothetical protein